MPRAALASRCMMPEPSPRGRGPYNMIIRSRVPVGGASKEGTDMDLSDGNAQGGGNGDEVCDIISDRCAPQTAESSGMRNHRSFATATDGHKSDFPVFSIWEDATDTMNDFLNQIVGLVARVLRR